VTSAATAPDAAPGARSRAGLVLAGAALAVGLALGAPGTSPADAQILTTTAPEPPPTTEAVPETTEAPTTTEPPATTAPPTTAAPSATTATTATPTTRPRATTSAPTTAPAETTTTAPPSAPPTIPVTTVPAEERTRVTQDTPDLGGVLTLWGLGIVGTFATMAWAWWHNRR
jgi:outer membrane biosynthesis protein TonB